MQTTCSRREHHVCIRAAHHGRVHGRVHHRAVGRPGLEDDAGAGGDGGGAAAAAEKGGEVLRGAAVPGLGGTLPHEGAQHVLGRGLRLVRRRGAWVSSAETVARMRLTCVCAANAVALQSRSGYGARVMCGGTHPEDEADLGTQQALRAPGVS